MTVHAPGVPHPRMAQRRAAVDAAAQVQEIRRRRLLWLGLALALALVCGYLATRSELLDVDNLEVSGAARTDVSEIVAASGVSTGQPLLGLDLDGARERIARLPWVKDVYSKRTWDGAVRFDVTERTAVAAVAMPGAWAVVEQNGRVLSVEPHFSEDPYLSEQAMPIVPIVGLNVAHADPGDWLDADQRGAVAMAGALHGQVGYGPVISAVQAIHVTAEGFVLELSSSGTVLLGDDRRLGAKMLALGTFIERVDLRCLKVLDVRAPGNPVLTRHNPCH